MWCLHALANENRIVNGDQENTLWRREIYSMIKIKNYSLMWVISLPRGCDPEVSAEVIRIQLQGSPPWEGPPVTILDFTTHSGFHGHTTHSLFIHSFIYSLTYLTTGLLSTGQPSLGAGWWYQCSCPREVLSKVRNPDLWIMNMRNVYSRGHSKIFGA